MKTSFQNERKVMISKPTIILAIIAVVVLVAVLGMLFTTGESPVTGGSVHSSSSPFSPMINYHDKPLVDPSASLAKQIEMKDGIVQP
jgi:hypothetical protein